MKRGWAESIAMIERRVRGKRGGAPRWKPIDLQSPTLTEKQADEAILKIGKTGQYRMVSVWSGDSPTRWVEFLDETSGISWQAIDWRPTNPRPTWKPNRTDDIADAVAHLRTLKSKDEYRVVTVRRMLLARRDKGKLKVIKKHFPGSSPA